MGNSQKRLETEESKIDMTCLFAEPKPGHQQSIVSAAFALPKSETETPKAINRDVVVFAVWDN